MTAVSQKLSQNSNTNPNGATNGSQTYTTAQAQQMYQKAERQNNTKAASYWLDIADSAVKNGGSVTTTVPTNDYLPIGG